MVLSAYLVEDSKTIQQNLIPALADLADAKVVGCAETEADAVRWFRSGASWDIAILDLFLREGSGLGVLDSLKHRHPSQRVVVLTNYPTEHVRTHCRKLGADAIFDKSTELDGFMEFCKAAPHS